MRQPVSLVIGPGPEDIVFEPDEFAGIVQIDGVRFYLQPIFGMADGQVNLAFQDAFHDRPIVGRKMLDHHIGPASRGGGLAEKGFERFQAAGRGPKSDQGNGALRVFIAECFWFIVHLKFLVSKKARYQTGSSQYRKEMGVARIFIADDDEDYLAAFRIGMESIGHKVFSVKSGAQVMDALRDGHYDIVFLDVVMPGGGAISLVHKIRLEYPDVLIVIMTGHSELYNTPVFTEGFRLATARIKKSASLDEIKAMLSSLLMPK